MQRRPGVDLRGANYAGRGANYAERGANYAERGTNYAERGANYAERGAVRAGLVPVAPEGFVARPSPAAFAAAAAAAPPGLCGEHADSVATAAATGALASHLFSDIVRRGAAAAGVPLAPCTCCQRVTAEAAAQLAHYRRLYDADAYVGSRAFAHRAARLARDLTADELAAVRRSLAAHGSGSADTDAANRAVPGLAVAAPACRAGAVWAYSTPDARQLARWLARRRAGFNLRVASADPSVFPRELYRLYEISGDGNVAALVRLWAEKRAAPAAAPAPAAPKLKKHRRV